MLKHGFFSFHIVELSPWPLLGSISLMITVIGMVEYLTLFKFPLLLVIGVILIIAVFAGWMRDIIRESTYQGMHTLRVQNGLKMGFVLFILSEVFFFISFFWSLFYLSLSPSLGWPPLNIISVNPTGLPLLGTIILVSSGISLTWAHHLILEGKLKVFPLLITIILGLIFTLIQVTEYMNCSFSISDSAFGSLFFISTGFHGIHVIIGSIYLLISLIRYINGHFSIYHHLGFESAAWYWHFVDVVWLFLYISAYWWAF